MTVSAGYRNTSRRRCDREYKRGRNANAENGCFIMITSFRHSSRLGVGVKRTGQRQKKERKSTNGGAECYMVCTKGDNVDDLHACSSGDLEFFFI